MTDADCDWLSVKQAEMLRDQLTNAIDELRSANGLNKRIRIDGKDIEASLWFLGVKKDD